MREPYITRLEILSNRATPAIGFQVRIRHYDRTKWFGVTTWGSEAKALAAAIRWRDKILRTPRPPAQVRAYRQLRRHENELRRKRRSVA